MLCSPFELAAGGILYITNICSSLIRELNTVCEAENRQHVCCSDENVTLNKKENLRADTRYN